MENGNRAHGVGALNLQTFKPSSKNPAISKVFREIGYADEFGSGMRNSYKYTQLYSGAESEFMEGDVFKTIIPLSVGAMTSVGPETSPVECGDAGGQVENGGITIKLDIMKLNALLDYCAEERTRS